MPRRDAAADKHALPGLPVPAPRIAGAITVAVLLGYATITAVGLFDRAEGSRLLLAFDLGCLAAVFLLQFHHCSERVRRRPPARNLPTLLAQAVLTYVPLFWMRDGLWGGTAGPLAASALLLLPSRIGWTFFGLVAAGTLPLAVNRDEGLAHVIDGTVSTGLTGLVIYGVTRFTDLVKEVHATRGLLAGSTMTRERLRFARDLHDVLGYSLSAITLKGELIYRLLPNSLGRVRHEVASVLDICRQALADIRMVASGYREMSLAAEADSTANILAMAGIDAAIDIRSGRLHPLVDTTLATTLREGVTNMLRHSKATTCTITSAELDGTVRLELINNGVAGKEAAAGGGSGLCSLRTRLSAIGGVLEAGPTPDGRFRLMAQAPAAPDISEEISAANTRE